MQILNVSLFATTIGILKASSLHLEVQIGTAKAIWKATMIALLKIRDLQIGDPNHIVLKHNSLIRNTGQAGKATRK